MEDYEFRNIFTRSILLLEKRAIFLDYPKAGSFDPNWKDRCTEIIGSCTGTIVLVGSTTFQSEPVAWEIEETRRQGLPLLGVQLPNQHRIVAPAGLTDSTILPLSESNKIASRIRAWAEELEI
jgi:hypothetical protein